MKVCFVALYSYPVFVPNAQGVFGGMETRSVTFARALAHMPGHELTFLVEDRGQPAKKVIDGMKVMAYSRVGGKWREKWIQTWDVVGRRHAKLLEATKPRMTRFPGRLLYLHPTVARSWLFRRVSRYALNLAPILFSPRRSAPLGPSHDPVIRDIYRRVNAEVFITFGMVWYSAEAVAACRRFGRKSVLFLMSNSDISAEFAPGARRINSLSQSLHASYNTIMNADLILAQTEYQRKLLRERFGRDGTVLRNPVRLDPAEPDYHAPNRHYALWVGRSDTHHKRPHLLIDVARRCPEIPFLMVLNRTEPVVYDRILESRPNNVTVIGRVPADQMPIYLRRARALVFTGSPEYEGFPNMFLHAGAFNTPIVSYDMDPDGVLARFESGLVAHADCDLMAEHLRRLWSNPDMAGAMTAHMRSYIQQFHDLDERVAELERILKELSSAK